MIFSDPEEIQIIFGELEEDNLFLIN